MGCNNYFDMTDQGDSFESWQGLRGPAGPQGTPGAPGSSVELKGPVATTGDLPATAPSGELWLVGAASPYEGYFYNGGSWEDLGQIAVGPEGPTGPQGETGATGPAGPGVPSGGQTRQVLKKQSNTDYDTAWQDDNLGITGASPNDLVRISAVGENGKPTVFGRISDPNTNVGIVQNGNTATQSISKGQYVIWHGALYTASAAIASGATLSSANLTAVTGGGLNALKPLSAYTWEDLYTKFINSINEQIFLVFLTSGVTNILTNGSINYSAKGFATKTDSQTLDAVLMTGAGGLHVGRFTISSSGSTPQSLKEATLTSILS